MLIEVSENLWINISKVILIRIETLGQAEKPGYFRLENDDNYYPLTQKEYTNLVQFLRMAKFI